MKSASSRYGLDWRTAPSKDTFHQSRILENSKQQPLYVRPFANVDQSRRALCQGAGVVHRLARLPVCYDWKKHQAVAARWYPPDLEAAIFYSGYKKIGGFRTSVLGCNHSGCRLSIAANNCSTDEPVPEDFKIHRTSTARERHTSSRRYNAQMILGPARQTAESIQAVIGGLGTVLCAAGSRRHSQAGHGLHLLPPGFAGTKGMCADEPTRVRQIGPVAKSR